MLDKEWKTMKYLVTSIRLPIPPEMSEAVVEMSKAAGKWYEQEMKAGRLVDAWVKSDVSGGVMLWEVESNDALFK